MSKINIIYWSQTGNTGMMASAIAEGIEAAGNEAEILFVSAVSLSSLENEPILVLGCPAMGAEVLEESEMEPFMCELESIISGKKVALFGSYGWGDGQWMREWEERVTAAGATIVGGEGLMCHETPDDDGLEKCRVFGKQIAGV